MSDSTIGNIRIGTSADTRAFVKSMKTSASSMDTVAVSAARASTNVNNLTFNRATTTVNNLKSGIGGLATGLIALGGARAIGGIVTTAINMENALVGLSKATDLEGAALAKMKSELFSLSTELKGVRLDDLIAIATSGAKLGIATDDLVEYTEGIAKLSTAMDDVPADVIADSIGKINLVFKLGVKGAEQLGSAIDKLADSGASSASGIMDVTQRISGAAAAMKLGAPEALSLAAALLDTGTEAEAGAGALNALLQKMVSVDRAADFADAIGVSVEKFSETVRTKPIQAISAFLAALKRMDAPTQLSVLDDLKFAEGRTAPNIQKLAQQVDTLKGYVGAATHEFATLDQITKSYAATAETTGALIAQTQNHLQIMSDTIGQALLPSINENLTAINGSGSEMGQGIATGIGVAVDAIQILSIGLKAGQAAIVNLEYFAVAAFDEIGKWIEDTARKLLGLGPATRDATNTFVSSLKSSAGQINAEFSEATAAPWASEAITKRIDAAKASTEGMAKAMGSVAPAAAAMGQAIEDASESTATSVTKLSKELKEQIATFGMTSSQALIYKLKLAGASEAQLDSVRALDAQRTAMEKSKALTEEFTKPLDAYKLKLKEIDGLLASGAITSDVASRATLGAKAELASKTETQGPTSAGALELGSAEARSAILNYKGADSKDEPAKVTAKNTAKQVDLQTQMAGYLKQLADQAGNSIAGGLTDIFATL